MWRKKPEAAAERFDRVFEEGLEDSPAVRRYIAMREQQQMLQRMAQQEREAMAPSQADALRQFY